LSSTTNTIGSVISTASVSASKNSPWRTDASPIVVSAMRRSRARMSAHAAPTAGRHCDAVGVAGG
jgi:hypothetical protein